MKKTLKELRLNKEVISNLHQQNIQGGYNTAETSQGVLNTCGRVSPMQFLCAH